MKTRWGYRLSFGALLIMVYVAFAPQAGAAPVFNDTAFAARWLRVDKPVEETSNAGRGYTWGPQVTSSAGVVSEQYNGKGRIVQYFDKARMEITNRTADPNQLYYVTTGLIVKELVTGKRQDGDNTFLPMQPSDVQVAGDPNDNGANVVAPTYASFRQLTTFSGTDHGAKQTTGTVITTTINRAGNVTAITPPESRTYSAYDSATQHNIADVFDRFNHQTGLIWNGSAYVQDSLFYNNTLYVLGHPVSEAYWTRAVVAGQEKDVLVQLFERRVLTYTPSNDDPNKVEMGNVGQHYWTWRYVRNARCATPQPAPATTTSGRYPLDFTQYNAESNASGGVPGGGAGNVLAYEFEPTLSVAQTALSLDHKMAVVSSSSSVLGLATSSDLREICAQWKYTNSNTFTTKPLLYNAVAYAGTEDGSVHAIDLATGTAKWVNRTNVAAILDTPITDGTNLYVVTANGRMQAYRLSDGYRVWQTPLLYKENGIIRDKVGPIFGFDGNIYFGWLDGKVYAYTPTGAPVAGWITPNVSQGLVYGIRTRMLYDGKNIFALEDGGTLYVLDKAGQTVASRKFGERTRGFYPPAIVGGMIYLTTHALNEPSRVIGVTKDLKKVTFSVDVSGVKYLSGLTVVDGRIYVGTDAGTVVSINATNAAQTILIPPGGGTTFIFGAPIVANGQIYMGGDTGKFYVVK